MRISDWSSDVCSSDLADDIAAGVRRSAAEIEAADRQPVAREAVHRPQAQHLVDGELAVVPMAAGGAGLALDVGGGQHVLSQDEAAQARREGLEAAEHAVGERSEEHTSELQSLMRISYAVFCLKKKK